DIRDVRCNLVGKMDADKLIAVFIIVLQTVVAAYPQPFVTVQIKNDNIVARYGGAVLYVMQILHKTGTVKFVESIFGAGPDVTVLVLTDTAGQVGRKFAKAIVPIVVNTCGLSMCIEYKSK